MRIMQNILLIVLSVMAAGILQALARETGMAIFYFAHAGVITFAGYRLFFGWRKNTPLT